MPALLESTIPTTRVTYGCHVSHKFFGWVWSDLSSSACKIQPVSKSLVLSGMILSGILVVLLSFRQTQVEQGITEKLCEKPLLLRPVFLLC